MAKIEIVKDEDGRKFVGKLKLSFDELDNLIGLMADIANRDGDSAMLFDVEFRIDGECEFGTLEITEE